MLESLFNKVAGLKAFQMISCEYCKIFKNTYFEEHLRMAASGACQREGINDFTRSFVSYLRHL